MYWKEIDPQNLPKGEVLVVNLESPEALDYGEKGLGRLEYDMGRIWCWDKFDNAVLVGATHYIEIDSIQISPKIEIKKHKLTVWFEEEEEGVFRGRSVKQSVRPVHPGEILLDYMEDFGMTVERLSQLLGVTLETIKEAIAGLQPITADLASRIGTALGNGDRLWLNLQQKTDDWNAKHPEDKKHE